jgi:thioredoxin-like negative regulator of GroEL
MIGKRVHIARIDGSKNQQFMGKYQVKGFPTVLLFAVESKDEPVTYQGERTAEAVTEWLKTQKINE